MVNRRKKKADPPPNPWTVWSDRWDALESLTDVQRAAVAATIVEFSVDHLIAFFGDTGLSHVRHKVLRSLADSFAQDPRITPKRKPATVPPEVRRRLARLNKAVKFIFDPKLTKSGFVHRRVEDRRKEFDEPAGMLSATEDEVRQANERHQKLYGANGHG